MPSLEMNRDRIGEARKTDVGPLQFIVRYQIQTLAFFSKAIRLWLNEQVKVMMDSN
jgi:hypothetical protein